MKTILNVLFTFAFLLVINSVFAVGNLKLNVSMQNSQNAIVDISSYSDEMFSLSLIDENGNTLYYRENEGSGKNFQKIFDLSKLENGTYRLKVVCNSISSERLIQKTNNNFLVGDESTTIAPYFEFNNNILKCTYLNFSKEKVVLHIFNSDSELFDKALGTEFTIHHGVDLSKLEPGDYTAVLNAGLKQFAYNIDVK
jgi:hypothetical protein